jgi:hypothetical protein
MCNDCSRLRQMILNASIRTIYVSLCEFQFLHSVGLLCFSIGTIGYVILARLTISATTKRIKCGILSSHGLLYSNELCRKSLH